MKRIGRVAAVAVVLVAVVARRRRRDWGGVRTPERRPASLGLGLCDVRNVLTPDELAALHADLASLAAARRRDYAAAIADPRRIG